MEYILFTVGAVLILISLILTYRADNDQDSYYLESELLSEIREVKQDIEDSFNQGQFQQLLEGERDNGKLIKEIKELQQTVETVEEKADSLYSKLNKLEERVTNLYAGGNQHQQADQEESETANGAFKPDKFVEIKELAEEGLSLSEIAHELDMGNREVDLIWKLNTRGEE